MKSKFILFIGVLASLVLMSCETTARNGNSTNLSASNHLAGFLRSIHKNGQPFNISIKPTTTGLITTCKGDEPKICDLLAAACEELGGVGQCGGDENPTGCQCET